MSIKNLLCYFGVGSFLISSLVAKPTIQWQANSENNDVKLSINNNSLFISGNSKKVDENYFTSKPIKLKPLKHYVFSTTINGMLEQAEGIFMTMRINHHSYKIIQWRGYDVNREFIFTTPPIKDSTIKVNITKLRGNVSLKNIKIREYLPLHAENGLQPYESIKDETYTFVQNIFHKNEHTTTPTYAEAAPVSVYGPAVLTNQWEMYSKSHIEYEIGNDNLTQFSGEIVIPTFYSRNSKAFMKISASADGKPMKEIITLTGGQNHLVKLPQDMFPAKKIKLRFAPTSKEVVIMPEINYRAKVDSKINTKGELLGSARIDISENVSVDKSSWNPTSNKLILDVKSQEFMMENIIVKTETVYGKIKTISIPQKIVKGNSKIELNLPSSLREIVSLEVSIPKKKWTLDYRANPSRFALVEEDFNGKLLPCKNKGVQLWQTSTLNKLSRNCKPPTSKANFVSLSAAGNESESIQFAIKADKKSSVQIEVDDLLHSDNSTKFSKGNIDVHLIEYVQIVNPVDYISKYGLWPDPIPLLKDGKFNISANEVNTALVKFNVPTNTKAGIYKGVIKIKCNDKVNTIPVSLKVYNFSLPKVPSIRSALLGDPNTLARYYKKEGLTNEFLNSQIREKLCKCKVSPYNRLSPNAKLVYPNNDKTKLPRVVIDWTEFDKETKHYIQKYNVNAILLKLSGVRWRPFNKNKPKILGIEHNDPRYEKVYADYLKQIDEHLVNNGWQNLFYYYGIDEPIEVDYPYVIEDLSLVKRYAPNLRLLLTEQPEKALYGVVDIWCPLSRRITQKEVDERRSKGEEIWWYVCMQPKAPYVTTFTDHPAIDLRLWLWQSFQCNLDGILIWHTTFYTPKKFPNGRPNQYIDGESWLYVQPGSKYVEGYGGDGRFLYPPYSTKDDSLAESNEPIELSIRLECLRDGIEDFEYLTKLKRLLAEKKNSLSKNEVEKYSKLLTIPPQIMKSFTEFSLNPKYLQQRRNEIANAIEEIQK